MIGAQTLTPAGAADIPTRNPPVEDRALAIDPNHIGAHEYRGELKMSQVNLVQREKRSSVPETVCQPWLMVRWTVAAGGALTTP